MERLGEYVGAYLEYCETRKKLDRKTIKAYRIDLEQFETYVEKMGCGCGKSGIEQYIAFLHRNYKGKSAKRKIAVIRTFFNYLEYEGLNTDNPLRGIRTGFREQQTLPKALDFGTVKQLWDAVHKETKPVYANSKIRDIAVLELLFATGIRVSELCSLKTDDIDLGTGRANILGKGARERIVQVCNKEALAWLRSYEKAFRVTISECGYFFVNRLYKRLSEQSVRNMLRGYAQAAGIRSGVTPHMIRHTFATLLLDEGVDIRHIQKMLGHSSITTTEIYTHVSFEKQKDVLSKNHPRNKLHYPLHIELMK
jgi:integrase/recombinase XerD